MRRLLLAACLTLAAWLQYAGPAAACINDRETVKVERDFKSNYEFRSDYYRARNREVDAALQKASLPAAKGPDADAYFALLDDKGVGLEFLGQHQEAVDLMRDKLKRQQTLACAGRDLYSAYANLGTFL